MRTIVRLGACALLGLSGLASAAPTPQAQREIDALIAALDGSTCQFQRNGSWHDATAARNHLQRKNGYLQRKGLADTAELFIERAASRSSVSGTGYRIRCPGQPEQAAAAWFTQRLLQFRERAR